MILLSIDLGKTMGIVVNAGKDNYLHMEDYKFTSYWEFDHKLKDLVVTYKPDLILIPYPTRFYNVIIAHAKLMGIVCLVGDKKEIPVVEVNDSQAKKVVLGNGRAKKEDIMNYFKVEPEHIADAMMFCEWYLKSV